MSTQTAPTAITSPPLIVGRGLPMVAARIAGSYAIVGGSITLVGWIGDVQILADWDRDGIAMFANAASCAILCGSALLLSISEQAGHMRQFGRRVAAMFAALIGGLTFFEHATGVNLGIDTLLIDRPWGQRASGAAPMRMGPPASLSFVILGIGLLMATYGAEARRRASALGVAAIAIASLSLTGYWFGADQLFGLARGTAIASQTSTIIAALGLGLCVAIPEHGLVAAFRRNDVAGVLIRRLMLPIILLPLLLGRLKVLGQEKGYFDTEFGTAALMLTVIAMLMALLFWTARGIGYQVEVTRVAELALRERDARLRSTFDQAAVGMAVAALDGHFLEMNQKFAEILGYTADELCTMKAIEVTHPDDQPRTREYMRRLLAGEISNYVCEKGYVRKDGTSVWCLTTVTVIKDDAGNAQRFIGVIEDITARKHAEQQLKDADRRKDEFIATLAHELRNPLAPIRNMLEIMKRGDGSVDLQLRARETIERQLNQLVRLVDDLLDVSRITRDRLELRTERTELAPIIQQAIDTCQPLISELGHTLSLNLPSQPIPLQADPVRLSQVFGNLINNACKYTPAGGRVSVAAECHAGVLKVTVTDCGLGIAPDMLSKVFDMFAQADSASKLTQGGLGIGLTLVKRLVEMHGGSVEARSAGPGLGSEFIVRLPQKVDELESTTPKQPQPQLPSSHRILVVDDNRDSALSLALLLKVIGNETFSAHDGFEALEMAERVRPEIVLLDIGMPKMNGYEVCRAIRERPWGNNVTIVALTGWGQDADRHKSSEAGFDHHLIKPAALNVLIDLLEQCSDRRTAANTVMPDINADGVQMTGRESDA